ncbi:protein tesmin/TSO1-like CXC 2 isoform X2 [Magnolia sinica]|uniref:protein tesmin/TSO1-like CXC 2 isoform X2 n=1 Tax=Magnolia sinica TaxID=86752 RepID=UPI0026584C38|nr:protein tesmin/TSO1-like CXC 2 isoform X2 [Magnolia sinica]
MKTEVPATVTSPEKAEEDPLSENSRVLIKPVTDGYGKLVNGAAEKNDEMTPYELPDLPLGLESIDALLDAYFKSPLGEQGDQHLTDQAATDFAPSVLSSEECRIRKCGKEMPVSSPGLYQHGTPDKLEAEGMMQHGNCDHTPLHLNDFSNDYNQTIEDQMPYDFKQHCISRRHLQFEASEAVVDSNTSSTSHVESTKTSNNKQVVNSFQPGIGLHLNRIGNAAAVNWRPSAQIARNDYLSAQGDKSLSESDPHSPKDSRGKSVPSIVVCNLSAKLSELDQLEYQASVPTSGSCKRGCNCKVSACLLKFCTCYQAGVGCSEACQCKGCQNSFGTAGQFVPFQTKPDSGKNKRSCRCKIARCTLRSCMCCKTGYGCTDECRCEGCQNIYGRRPPYNASLMQ